MSRARTALVGELEASGVIAVVRLTDARAGAAVARALAAGGVTHIEVTMTVPNAVGLIAELSRDLGSVTIGAGTVTNAATADAVIDAGARFVVGPVFRPAVIAACHARDVVAIPGCFTPTEILSAWELGADLIKVFPATSLGPGFLKDVRAPLPQVRLVPTGGVTRENAGDWIRAGAVAIGVGTALVDPAAVAAGRFDVITANAAHFVEAVHAARPAGAVR